MNELRRMAYLDALGIDSYVSRTQMPGAAVTRRLAIIPAIARAVRTATNDVPSVQVTPAPREADGARPVSDNQVGNQATPQLPEKSSQPGPAAPRFSLVAIVAGDWLWLEELDGMPLTTQQVQLVQAMAQALVQKREPGAAIATETAAGHTDATRPQVAQFDWPIHTNQQLDLGADAARASVAGFVVRRLEQHGCRGLVLLGQSCAVRVPLQEVKLLTVSTASTAQILAQPALKRTVWRDLLPLVDAQ